MFNVQCQYLKKYNICDSICFWYTYLVLSKHINKWIYLPDLIFHFQWQLRFTILLISLLFFVVIFQNNTQSNISCNLRLKRKCILYQHYLETVELENISTTMAYMKWFHTLAQIGVFIYVTIAQWNVKKLSCTKMVWNILYFIWFFWINATVGNKCVNIVNVDENYTLWEQYIFQLCIKHCFKHW